MSAREVLLKRIRTALGAEHRPGAVSSEIGPRGQTGYQGAGIDPVGRFLEQFKIAGGKADLAENRVSAKERVLELVQRLGPRRLVLGQALIFDEMDLLASLQQRGLDVRYEWTGTNHLDRDEMFAADMGISGADYLIAETGSLVLHTCVSQSRSLSLLPPIHLVVAEAKQIVPDLFDYFDILSKQSGQSMPSGVTLITGPSKTGDIELRLVTGVHGPGELRLILVG
jgi:L-lactate dehydrogenase complex protein LldG